MAMRAGIAYVMVDGRTIKFERAMARARRRTQQFERQAATSTRNAARSFGALGRALKSTTGQLAAFISVAAGLYAIRGAIMSYNAFATEMNNVKAVSGATTTQFSLLNEKAQELGATTKFTAGQVASAMSFMAMAGLKNDQIYQGVEHTLNLAAAANMDLGQSADIVTNIMTAMNLSVSELGHATDILVKTFTSSNTKLGDLGYAFKFVAPAAMAAGVSFEEVAASLGLLGNAGMQGTLAGTAMRVALIRLQAPTPKATKMMKALGIEVYKANGRLKSMVDIVKELEPHMQNAPLLKEMFGVRGYVGMVNLISQGSDKLKDFVASLKDVDGTSKRIAETQMEGLPGALKRLEAAIEAVAVALGESRLGKMFTLFIEDLGAASRATATFINSLKSLGEQSLATIRSQRVGLEQEYIKLGETIDDLYKTQNETRYSVVNQIEKWFTPGAIEKLQNDRAEVLKNINNLKDYERALVRIQNKALKPVEGGKKPKVVEDPEDAPPGVDSGGVNIAASKRASALKSLEALESRYLEVTQRTAKLIEVEHARELAKFQKMLDEKLISQEQFEKAREQLAAVTAKRLEEMREKELKAYNDIAASISGSLESAMRSFVEKGKVDFKELTNSILSDLAVISLRMAVLGPLFGQAGGGQGLGFLGNLLAGVFHGGGKVGTGHGVTRAVPAAVFMGAPRLHNGGQVLRSGEVPAILQRGETVSPANSNDKGVIVQVVNNTPAKASVETDKAPDGREIRRIVISEVNRAVADGSMDGSMRSRFGTKTRGTRR